MDQETQEELDHFESALQMLPYVSAMLQQDDVALGNLFSVEEHSTAEIGSMIFSFAGILVDILADIQEQNRMETIQELGLYFQHVIDKLKAEDEEN
jgi:hypothetical protein